MSSELLSMHLDLPSPRQQRELLFTWTPKGWDVTDTADAATVSTNAEGSDLHSMLQVYGLFAPAAIETIMFRVWTDIDKSVEMGARPATSEHQEVLNKLAGWIEQTTLAKPSGNYFGGPLL